MHDPKKVVVKSTDGLLPGDLCRIGPLLPRRAQVRVQHDSPVASSAIVAASGAEPVKSRVPHTAPGEHAVGASVKNSAPA